MTLLMVSHLYGNNFFPGFEFEEEKKLQRQQFLQTLGQMLEGEASEELRDYETQVLDKYTRFGTLTTFKDVAGIQEGKRRLDIKRRMEQLSLTIQKQRDRMDDIEIESKRLHEEHQSSRTEIDKICRELEQLFLEEKQKIVIPRDFGDKLFHIPEHPKLMRSERFRMLRNHYASHMGLLHGHALLIEKLSKEHLQLEASLQQKEQMARELEPEHSQVQELDYEDYAEMHVIAKNRKKIVPPTHPKPVLPIKQKIQYKPLSEKMTQFYQQSIQKVQLEKQAKIQALEDQKRKQEEALRALTEKAAKRAQQKAKSDTNQEDRALERKRIEREQRIAKILETVASERKQRPVPKKRVVKEIEEEPEVQEAKARPEKSMFPSAKAMSSAGHTEKEARKPIPVMKLLQKKTVQKTEHVFTWDPPQVIFKDVSPGTRYMTTLQFRNISHQTEQFRFVDAQVEVGSILQVDHPSHRKIGSGSYTTVDFTIELPLDYDGKKIESGVTFKTSTQQMMFVPVLVLPPECKPQIEKISKDALEIPMGKDICLDFGSYVQGTVKSMWIEIVNKGFLETEYTISPSGDESAFVALKPTGTLKSYGSKRVYFELKPQTEETTIPLFDPETGRYIRGSKQVSGGFVVQFSQPVDPIPVKCLGACIDAPLFADKSLMDFKWCYTNVMYHDRLYINNVHFTSLRFWLDFGPHKIVQEEHGVSITVPSVCKISVSTSFGFVQPHQPLPMWVSLCLLPDAKGLVKIDFALKYVELSTLTERSFPIVLQCNVDDHRVELNSPQFLDFGQVSVFEEKQVPVQFTNHSTLPQFVQVELSDPVFRLIDDDRFSGKIMRLEPQTTIERWLSFAPQKDQVYGLNLSCKTTGGYTSHLKFTGHGFVPPLCFKPSFYTIAPTAFGASNIALLLLERSVVKFPEMRHLNHNQYEFEFGKPLLQRFVTFEDEKPTNQDISDAFDLLSVWPSQGSIQSGQFSSPIELQVTVPTKSQLLLNEDGTSTTGMKEALGKSQSALLEWLVPCKIVQGVNPEAILDAFVQGTAPAAESRNNNLDRPPSAPPTTESWIIYVQVGLQVQQSDFEFVENQNMQYDTLFLGEKQIKSIEIRNLMNVPLQLKLSGLNPTGPFYLPKAIRPIPPKKVSKIDIGFLPREEGSYLSTIEFEYNQTHLQVDLRGEAFRAVLEAQLEKDRIQFGNVCLGDVAQQTFTVVNKGSLETECILSMPQEKQWKHYGMQNSNGSNPFSVSPLRQTIAPGQSVEITVKFNPDCPSDLYFDSLHLTYNYAEPLVIALAGRAWASTLIVSGYEPHPLMYREYHPPLNNEFDRVLMKAFGGKLEDLKLDDTQLGNAYLKTRRKEVYFCEFYMDWVQVPSESLGYAPGMKMWTIPPKEIILSNLKPINQKPEPKKPTVGEFVIEEFPGSFHYDPFLEDYVLQPLEPQTLRFVPDTQKGQIDLGSNKTILFKIEDSLQAFYKQATHEWEKHASGEILHEPQVRPYRPGKGDPLDVKCAFEGSEALYFDEMVKRRELLAPAHVETCFKITLKGGMWTSLTKAHPPGESVVFYMRCLSRQQSQ
ncbi:hypothetical protein EDD86DRAFT_273812 [Gorgonomyces haynaldii]|nr:hypothetical protein EDD86DRAFT_273812 [Gorgonomyces haynaldii]